MSSTRSRYCGRRNSRIRLIRLLLTLAEATLQIIASEYYELLGDFSAEALKPKLAEDPLKYTRFLQVFARLVREILNLKKHREASAKEAALERNRLHPN